MASVGSTASAKLLPQDTGTTIYNVVCTLANTEYSQALPGNTKGFTLKCRTTAKLQLAFASGNTNTLYLTVPGGAVFEDQNFRSAQVLYFQTDKPNTTIEIVANYNL